MTVHVGALLGTQLADHPPNWVPAPGVAVKVTADPVTNGCVHEDPCAVVQEITLGLAPVPPDTDPDAAPVPIRVTPRVAWLGVIVPPATSNEAAPVTSVPSGFVAIAVIAVDPPVVPTAVAKPFLLMVPTDTSLEFHVTKAVQSCNRPVLLQMPFVCAAVAENVPIAMYCDVSPKFWTD